MTPEPHEAIAEARLTDAERETLVGATGMFGFNHDTIYAAVERIITERERETAERAWREGHLEAFCDYCRCKNPYGKSRDTDVRHTGEKS